jgi:hypothetical protein
VLGNRPPIAMKRFYESNEEIKPMIREAVLKEDHELFGKLQTYVDTSMPMEFTSAITRGTTKQVNWVDKMLKEPFYAENELGYRLLEAQGLIIGHGHSYPWQDGETPVGVDWVSLTDLGTRFVARVIPRPSEKT